MDKANNVNVNIYIDIVELKIETNDEVIVLDFDRDVAINFAKKIFEAYEKSE